MKVLTIKSPLVFFFFRSRIQRERERDVSEKIALGLPSTSGNQDTQFDQRLFNQSSVSNAQDLYLNETSPVAHGRGGSRIPRRRGRQPSGCGGGREVWEGANI